MFARECNVGKISLKNWKYITSSSPPFFLSPLPSVDVLALHRSPTMSSDRAARPPMYACVQKKTARKVSLRRRSCKSVDGDWSEAEELADEPTAELHSFSKLSQEEDVYVDLTLASAYCTLPRRRSSVKQSMLAENLGLPRPWKSQDDLDDDSATIYMNLGAVTSDSSLSSSSQSDDDVKVQSTAKSSARGSLLTQRSFSEADLLSGGREADDHDSIYTSMDVNFSSYSSSLLPKRPLASHGAFRAAVANGNGSGRVYSERDSDCGRGFPKPKFSSLDRRALPRLTAEPDFRFQITTDGKADDFAPKKMDNSTESPDCPEENVYVELAINEVHSKKVNQPLNRSSSKRRNFNLLPSKPPLMHSNDSSFEEAPSSLLCCSPTRSAPAYHRHTDAPDAEKTPSSEHRPSKLRKKLGNYAFWKPRSNASLTKKSSMSEKRPLPPVLAKDKVKVSSSHAVATQANNLAKGENRGPDKEKGVVQLTKTALMPPSARLKPSGPDATTQRRRSSDLNSLNTVSTIQRRNTSTSDLPSPDLHRTFTTDSRSTYCSVFDSVLPDPPRQERLVTNTAPWPVPASLDLTAGPHKVRRVTSISAPVPVTPDSGDERDMIPRQASVSDPTSRTRRLPTVPLWYRDKCDKFDYAIPNSRPLYPSKRAPVGPYVRKRSVDTRTDAEKQAQLEVLLTDFEMQQQSAAASEPLSPLDPVESIEIGRSASVGSNEKRDGTNKGQQRSSVSDALLVRREQPSVQVVQRRCYPPARRPSPPILPIAESCPVLNNVHLPTSAEPDKLASRVELEHDVVQKQQRPVLADRNSETDVALRHSKPENRHEAVKVTRKVAQKLPAPSHAGSDLPEKQVAPSAACNEAVHPFDPVAKLDRKANLPLSFTLPRKTSTLLRTPLPSVPETSSRKIRSSSDSTPYQSSKRLSDPRPLPNVELTLVNNRRSLPLTETDDYAEITEDDLYNMPKGKLFSTVR